MGLSRFLRPGRHAAAPAPLVAGRPRVPPRRSPDASLERLEAEFGPQVAVAAGRLRAAVQWHRGGRQADAWAALEGLLANPGVSGASPARAAIDSEIYSRLRICYEREGCFNPAVTPAVLAYATRAKFCAAYGREAEFLALRSPSFFARHFTPLLQRARLGHALPRFTAVVEEHLQSLPLVELRALRNAVEAFRLNPSGRPRPTPTRGPG